MKIGVTLVFFQPLGIIPAQITELKTCVKEAAVIGIDALRTLTGKPSRPSALFSDKLATSLDTSSTVISFNSKINKIVKTDSRGIYL